jgi:transcriptional regulator with XRE-family HTH domain
MTIHVAPQQSSDLIELLRRERLAFAAKMRMARAMLGWSQSEFGRRVGLTQRAIHKLEQGGTEPRRATVCAIEQTWREQGLDVEDLAEGGFRVTVRGALLDAPGTQRPARHARWILG